MSTHQRLGVFGLFTNPNTHKAPDGALLRAEEVILRRPGVAGPRPGFHAGSTSSLASLLALIPYDGKIVRVGPTNGTSTTYSGSSGTTAVKDSYASSPSPAALQWYRDGIRSCELRGNLYLSTKDTTRLLTSGTEAVAMGAGAFPPNILSAALVTSGSFLPTGSSVSYRLVYKRVDANGLESLSAPSGQFSFYNSSGGDRGAQLVISWLARWGTRSTDTIQVYRSENATGDTTPDDLHFLVAEIKIGDTTADADGRAGTYTFTDNTTSADALTSLGAALYINATATNGGAQASNIRPPAAGDLAMYQGSLFWSGITDYARKTISWEATAAISSSATGIGYRTVNSTRTHNSASVTVASATGLKIGMVLSTSDSNWSTFATSAPVRITNISGTTLTMSATWTGSTDGSPVSLVYCDSICIGSTSTGTNYYRADFANYFIEAVNRGLLSALGPSLKNPDAFAYAVGCVASAQLSRTYTVAIEAYDALTTLSLSATHGSEYHPPLPEPSATATTVAPDAIYNGVGWSQRDLPEHRHLADITRVGNAKAPVVRIFGTKEALWVLKGKGGGIHRISGAGAESGFREDLVDSTTYLLHGNLACQMEDTIYAWTNKGLVSISDGGIERLSAGPIADLTHGVEVALDSVTGYEHACFAVANPKDHEVIFGLPPASLAASPDAANRTFVFNVMNGGFSEWFVGDQLNRCAAYDTATRALLFGRNNSGTYRVERLPSASVINADDEYTGVEIVEVDGNDITINTGSYVANAGDIIVTDAGIAIVTAANGETNFTVNDGSLVTPPTLDEDEMIVPSIATAYKAFTSALEWTTESGQAPSTLKRFRDVILHFDDTFGLYTWDVIVDSSRDFGTEHSETRPRAADRDYSRSSAPRDDRTLVSRAHTMASRLYPTVEIAQADSRWQIGGVSIGADIMTTRVNA